MPFILGSLLFALSSMLCAPLHAKGAGSSSANFLKMGVGGRGVAMGEAHTAAVDDVMALYWNPSVLGRLNQNEVGFMHNNYFQGIDHDVLYYAHPLESKGTLGAGLSLLRVGDIMGFDEFGNASGDVTTSDTLFTLGWGKSWAGSEFLPGLHTGLNLKFLNKKLGNDSASTYMGDIGLLYETQDGLFQRLRTGLVLQNLGSGVNFISEKSDLPRQMKLGFAYPFFGDNLTFALDLVSPSDNKAFLNAGVDYKLWDILALRLGYKGQSDLNSGLTYGMRFGNERLHLDYAFVPFGDIGDSHRLSVGFRFGRTYRQTQVQAQIRKAYERAEARYAQGFLMEAYIQAAQIMDVAPWHRPSRALMRRVEGEFKQLEDSSNKDHLQAQMNEHFAKGEEYFNKDELLPARREFEAILNLQPGHVGAETYLKRIDERFHSIVQNFYETAMRAFAASDYKQAKEYLDRVLVVEPNHIEAREQLARVVRLMDDQRKVEEEKARVETVRPVYNSALDAFKAKDYEAALKKFDQILAIDPSNAEAKRYQRLCRELVAKQSYEIGMAAAQEGRWEEASQVLTKALKYKPDFPEAQKILDKVNANRDESKKEEAQRYYKEGLDHFLQGEEQKAAELWQKAYELNPEDPQIKNALERVQRR
jgi:tetratricopeptide (TPR) repeat protein